MNQKEIDINRSFTLPCGAVLKNRIAKAALTERLTSPDHLPSDQHLRLYDHWAKNGAGLLLTGNILVDRKYLESTRNVVIETDTIKTPFREWTTQVKNYGNQFWAQLSHAGRQSSIFSTRRPVSASDVQLKKMAMFAKPRPLSVEGIEDVIERFVHAAVFCKEVGFTGVQFHAAHGYLINQFLSPKTNLRKDKWGGSLENRTRLLYQIVDRTRKSVGPSFPISVKLNSADFQRGGFEEEDSIKVIQTLEAMDVDLVEISGGTYEQSAMMGIGMKESTRSREAYFLEFARKVRKHSKIALMVTGGFRTLTVCEEALKNDELDLIGFGRPFLMEESFPKGFLEGSMKQVPIPEVKVLDKKNADAAEAAYYDLQIKRLADGKSLKFDYSALRVALHIPKIEMVGGFRNLIKI